MNASTRLRALGLAVIGLVIIAGTSINAHAAAARPKPGAAAKPATSAKPVRSASLSSLGSFRTGGRQDRANSAASAGRRMSGQSAVQVSGTAAAPAAWQAPPAARAPAATAPPPLVRQNASASLQPTRPRELQRTSSSGTLVRMTTSPPVQ